MLCETRPTAEVDATSRFRRACRGGAPGAVTNRAHLAVAAGLVGCAVLWLAGCATQPQSASDSSGWMLPGPGGGPKATVMSAPAVDTAVEDRILALDPEHITEHD